MRYPLPKEERRLLEVAYRAALNKRIANKINTIVLFDKGLKASEISNLLMLDESTIRRYCSQYFEEGLEKYIESKFKGGLFKLSAEQLIWLEDFVDQNLCKTTDEIIEIVRNEFNVEYSRSGMAKLLRQLDFVFKKTSTIPGKLDPQKQDEFLEYYKNFRKMMPKNCKTYFLDGVHPTFNSVPGTAWVKKGKEKFLKSNTGRKRVNLNGALDIDSLELLIREDNTLDKNSTLSLLRMIEEHNQTADKIALIVDNARYYYNKDVKNYIKNSDKLEMIYLPPYSPNLNLIERVWKFMKTKVIRNQRYDTFLDFKNALGDFFQNFPDYIQELDSLLVEEFQTFPVK